MMQKILTGIPGPRLAAPFVDEDVFIPPLGDDPHFFTRSGEKHIHHRSAAVDNSLDTGEDIPGLLLEIDIPVLESIRKRLPNTQGLILGGSCRLADGEVSLTVHHHHVSHGAAGITGHYLYLFFHVASLQVPLKLGLPAYPIHTTVSTGYA
ncbi:hypothetical protein ES703_35358 [subsurface metagenome]